MAEEQTPGQQQPQLDSQVLSPRLTHEDLISCVSALEAALLPCLSTRELQSVNHYLQPSHQHIDASLKESDKELSPVEFPSIQSQDNKEQEPLGFSPQDNLVQNPKEHTVDVEKHARDFMEAAKKLQLYFIDLQRQHQDQPTEAEMLKKEIAEMEQELKIKNEIIRKHEGLILRWRKELKDELEKHKTELGRV